MTQRDVQDHWDSLANQLGAEPQLNVAPITPITQKASLEPSRRSVGVPRARPPSTDWAEVAVQLGVVGSEPITEARKWRLRETPELVKPREVAREAPPERRAASGFGAGLVADEAQRREESSAAAAKEVEQSAAAAAPWLAEIESEGQPEERRRRRKRRRARGDRGRPEDRSGQPTQEPLGAEPGAESEVQRADEGPRARYRPRPEDAESVESRRPEREGSDEEGGEAAPREGEISGEERPAGESPDDRPRRGRRRRGRRGGERRPREEGAAPRSQPRARAAEDAADAGAEDAVITAAEGRLHEPIDDEEEDAEDQEARAEDHRNIPAWQEAIGVIIDKNMEERAKNPHPYRSRGRGRGRG